MSRERSLWTAAAFLGVVITASVSSDTVLLKDGRLLQGKIVKQTHSSLTIRVGGRFQTLEKSKISETKYEDPPSDQPRVRLVPPRNQVRPLPAEPVVKSAVPAHHRPDPGVAKSGVGGALWRSALLPGWGLLYLEQWPEASIYAALFVASGMYARRLRQNAIGSERRHGRNTAFVVGSLQYTRTNASPPGTTDAAVLGGSVLGSQFFFQDYRRDRQLYQRSLALLGLVYSVQVVHTYFSRGGKQPSGGDAGPGSAAREIRWSISVDRNQQQPGSAPANRALSLRVGVPF